jgi:putative transposase
MELLQGSTIGELEKRLPPKAYRAASDEKPAEGHGTVREALLFVARSLRIQAPDLIRHVMSRGNGRQTVFLDDRDYRQFIHLLGEVVTECKIDCWNYCVMPNHYHATLQPTLPNLSEAIRRINSSYAQWWNNRHDRVGHVFQGRFKDQIVDREGYLLTLTRYVVMNPVRAKLVQTPDAWRWSSYRATVGMCQPPPFLATTRTLGLFGDAEPSVLQSRFGVFVGAAPDEGDVDRIQSNEKILGGKEFKERLAAG